MLLKIKSVREKKRLSQMELAQKSGLSRATIVNYEAEKRVPRVDDLEKIALALGCDIRVFFQSVFTNDFKELSQIINWFTRWVAGINDQVDEGHEVAALIADLGDPSKWTLETIRLKRYIKQGIPNLERFLALLHDVPDDEGIEKAG
jgi:transcriptional regulator with XRE-family HTH domain